MPNELPKLDIVDDRLFTINYSELIQLIQMLEREYISNEFYPLVRVMIKRANQFLDDNNELSNRTSREHGGS